jgi:hypothetical protein
MKLKQDAIPLSYTPRKFISHPTNGLFYLIESDHRVLSDAAAAQKALELVSALLLFIEMNVLTFHQAVRRS